MPRIRRDIEPNSIELQTPCGQKDEQLLSPSRCLPDADATSLSALSTSAEAVLELVSVKRVFYVIWTGMHDKSTPVSADRRSFMKGETCL